MKTNLITLLLVSFVFFSTQAQNWKTYPYTPEGSLISFATDEGAHASEPTEWWYTNGELVGKTTGTTYTYLLIYFRSTYSYAGFDGFRIINIMDESTGMFYTDTKPVNYESISETELNIVANVFTGGQDQWATKRNSENQLIPFEYTISATSPYGALDIEYTSSKAPLILGDNGYLEQASENYTYYYSQTHNTVSGNISLNGITESVTGTSWVDRQYGDFNPYLGERYEWFSIQLSNGMDINAYHVFTEDYEIPDNLKYRVFSAYVDETTQYTTSDFKLERLSYHWTEDEEKCYANKWRLTSEQNQVDLIIATRHKNAEITVPIRFFEDATTITGTVNGKAVTGIGFAELIHSYDNPEITINEISNNLYTSETPISWNLENPDDARTTLYDVLYSTDGEVFNTLIANTSDMIYSGDVPNLTSGDSVWFKIIAHTADDVLQSETISGALIYTVLSVEDAYFNDMRLFPNPTKNQLYLNGVSKISGLQYQILDVSGRIVYQSNKILNSSNTIEINTQQLYSGLYFLKCQAAEAEKSFKFIKE
ncbi:hypothetical protein containing AttH-like domain [Formosa agariphila KMM 3901]|uniref:Secretion system C-terminal sorting domain-containing protein n=1 Tax=Formosa agariphila (strain DSM 15362 / KCTC 12365 / LMG 23005 / KMM 3901 / M-2Alg 35-1) TaxID=1347342 RepID=T2KMR0_FORAG|nr:lipocalin-like domain-containing protein [Formosa agariphila]CDF79716.1 hypothetical protein containing AttH-like domain [Formosa agariphila KMM 3901]